MKYYLVLAGCIFLFAKCRPDTVNVQPTGSYDTLGIHWMTIERSNITYYFQGTGASGASIYTDMHEEAFTKLNQVFNAKLPQKLRYFVWTDWVQGEQLLNYTLSFAVSRACVCHVTANAPLGHEITHVLSYWAEGTRPISYNKFINEGIAVAFDLDTDNKIGTAKSAIKGKNIHSVADVWSGSYSATDDVLYPLGGAFAEFLYKQSTHAEFFALIKNQTIEDAETIYGKERLNALIANFNTLAGL